MHSSQLMKFVGDIESSEDGNFARIDGQRSGRNLTHAPIDVFSQLLQILRIAVRAHRISLVVNLTLDSRRGVRLEVSVDLFGVGIHTLIVFAISGSAPSVSYTLGCI